MIKAKTRKVYACTRQVEIGDILDAKHGTDRLRRHTPADKALALKIWHIQTIGVRMVPAWSTRAMIAIE